MEAIVLAGGLGTRLRSVISDCPKVLAPISGKPFLDFLFEYLAHYGVTRIVLSVCYKKEQIRNQYGNRFGNLTIDYCEEEQPLGTGGAVQKSLSLCESKNIFVFNGDSLFLVPFGEMLEIHKKTAAIATLAVRKVLEGDRYGGVLFDGEGRIQSFLEKKITGSVFINGGVYCLNRPVMEEMCRKWLPPFSLEKDVFPKMIQENNQLYAFPSGAFFIDIGVPESFEIAQTTLPSQFPITG